MKKVELLSPAGDYNCFIAAMNAGADAVYLSGEKFGARAYAKNFSKDELIKAIDYAHLFDRKVFLTVNTLLKNDELNELYDYLLPYYEAGLDGVIVQDIGVISYIRDNFKDLPVHASTQLAITDLNGVKLLESLSVVRTVLARELSLNEIKYIKDNSNMELETFVHGSLCYSYSGKCLFSSMVGGRSGNRGRCAGSCRQPYNDKYLLSTKDICCLSILPDIIDAGVVSLKIEGRMKSPEYVAGVTSLYRKYIDIYYDNIESLSLKEIKDNFFKGDKFLKDLDVLTRLYTRGGNSSGYYYAHNGRDMISLSDASYKSDKGDVKASINENYVGISDKIDISGFVRIFPNENISILINNEYYYEGCMASVSNNRPLDDDSVRKQLNKTGETEFKFDDLNIDIADNVFIRISDLNEFRRNALNEYKDYLLTKYRRNVDKASINNKSDGIKVDSNISDIKINCEVLTLDQLNIIANLNGIEGVYISYDLVCNAGTQIIDDLKHKGKKVYLKFQSVIRNNFLEKNADTIISLFDKLDGVLSDSHEVIRFILDHNFTKPVIGDIHIYSLNNNAFNTYRDLGFSKLTVPVELNKKEIIKMGIQGQELLAYGYIPMMISAQCVNNTLNGCNKRHTEIALKDRRGAEFIACNNCSDCSNTIYNNVPVLLQGEEDFIGKIMPSSIRLSFTIENNDEITEICNYFTSGSYLRNLLYDNSSSKIKFTKGHLNRGVL